jgi:hypothetical protein
MQLERICQDTLPWLISVSLDSMPRHPRDFSKRSPSEQKLILEDTWCNACHKADLGMLDPVEFEQDSKVIVEGVCTNCGGPVRTTVVVKDAKEI